MRGGAAAAGPLAAILATLEPPSGPSGPPEPPAGSLIWLDPLDVSVDVGQRWSSWTSKGSIAQVFGTVAGQGPMVVAMSGLPSSIVTKSLRFAGYTESNTGLLTTFASAAIVQPFVVVAVFRAREASFGSNNFILDSEGTGGGFAGIYWQRVANNAVLTARAPTQLVGPAVSLTTWTYGIVTYDGNNSRHEVRGSATTGPMGANVIGGASGFGCFQTGNNANCWRGEIAELLIYPLASFSRPDTLAFLSAKYGPEILT